MRLIFTVFLSLTAALGQAAQEAPRSEQNPPVKVNVLNVCTPSAGEQQELRTALGRLPKTPSFAADYEVSRGVSTLAEGKSAKYIRVRRDVAGGSPLATIQYSLSSDPENTIETLVFSGRDAKDLLALSIEDKLSTAVSRPATVVQSNTPASHLSLERAGKTTVALARCEAVDQAQYEPIFAQASSILANYRHVLRLRSLLASDIVWLNSGQLRPNIEHGAHAAKK